MYKYTPSETKRRQQPTPTSSPTTTSKLYPDHYDMIRNTPSPEGLQILATQLRRPTDPEIREQLSAAIEHATMLVEATQVFDVPISQAIQAFAHRSPNRSADYTIAAVGNPELVANRIMAGEDPFP